MLGSRRHWVLLLTGVALLGLFLAAGTWWAHTSRPAYRLRRGQEALRRGDAGRAERYAQSLADAGAADHAHLLRGEIMTRAGRYARAVMEFNEIRDQGDLRRDAVVFSGQCLLALNNRREAERAFRFVLSENPDQVDAHRGLAAVYYDQGALDPAVHHLQEVARLDSRDGRPHRLMGLIFKDLDERDRAIGCYKEALRRDLKAAVADEVRDELAECLNKKGRYREALDVLGPSDAERLESPRRSAVRSEALWASQRGSEAAALLDEALRTYPQAGELLRQRARLHLDGDDPKAAAALLEQAVAADRHDHASRLLLGDAYQRLQRPTEAAEQRRLGQETIDRLKQMTQLSYEATANPWDAAVRERLAGVCEELDKPELAKMWHQAAAAARVADPRTPVLQPAGP